MSGSSKCPHNDFHFNLNFQIMGDCNSRLVDVTCKCKSCGVDMIFPGVPVGVSLGATTVSPDGKELRIAMVAEGEVPSKQLDVRFNLSGLVQ